MTEGGLAGQVVDSEPIEGVRLLTLKRGSGVVTINGSFMGGDVYANENNSRVPDYGCINARPRHHKQTCQSLK